MAKDWCGVVLLRQQGIQNLPGRGHCVLKRSDKFSYLNEFPVVKQASPVPFLKKSLKYEEGILRIRYIGIYNF